MSARLYMQATSGKAPWFSYALAAILGPVCTLSCLFFAGGEGSIFDGQRWWGVLFAVFELTVGHALAGFALGLAWPRNGWRWGVWLCAVSACGYSFYFPAGPSFLLLVAVTLAPACVGAHVASRMA